MVGPMTPLSAGTAAQARQSYRNRFVRDREPTTEDGGV